MSTLVERLQLLAQRIAAECVTLNQGLAAVYAAMGELTSLTTDDKTTIVAAINEVLAKVGVVSTNLANFTAAEATDLAAMTTTAKGTYGQAVNELKLSIDTLATVMNGKFGDLSTLNTTEKGSVVGAINEVLASLTSLNGTLSGIIDDALTASTTKTWSVDRIKVEIQAAKDALLGGAGAAIDTLKELGDLLAAEESLSAAFTAALAKRVAVDQVQVFTTAEKLQGCENLGIGDPDADLVAVFETALAGGPIVMG